MMQKNTNYISVCDPIGKAIEEVKTILFRPFDLKKWFIIGFCAWIISLGGGGGPGGSGEFPNMNIHNNGSHFDIHKNDVHKAFDHTKEFVQQNTIWLIPVVCAGLGAILLIWLVLIWLSSRGHFMFLHCVAQNKAEVQIPWTKYSPHGNSLFLFRIAFGIISTIVVILYIVIAALGIFVLAGGGEGNHVFGAAAIIAMVFGIFGLIFLCLTMALIEKFTRDFVIPIMYLKTASCVSAWCEFLKLLSVRKGAFFLYILFQLVIVIAIEAVILAMVLFTCCCAACIMMSPYIGTVFLLPILIFKRAYALHYLRQFGHDYDVFASRIELNAEVVNGIS